jgi:hypothetical protein
MDHNKAGVKILAGLAIIGGVIFSADSFYQWFGGKPFFPFWELRATMFSSRRLRRKWDSCTGL